MFEIIQGGMGVGISLAPLARAVSILGQLGVISGTVLDVLLARRLLDGDEGGQIRQAASAFPDQSLVARVFERYFREPKHSHKKPYKTIKPWSIVLYKERCELGVLAGFVEVWLAKHGHSGMVGLNLLEKLSFRNLAILYGALLAGVDVLLVGAGIPGQYPGLLDNLTQKKVATLKVPVTGDKEGVTVAFDPAIVQGDLPAMLKRPLFFAIVSLDTLAVHLAKKGGVDGFVIEGPTAGGHNAPPRGKTTLFNEYGEPVYGSSDEPNLARIAELGVQFYLAGGYGHPHKLQEALQIGASGVQVGTPFALCRESGMDPKLRCLLLRAIANDMLIVRNSARASPTGMPFHVAQLAGTLSEQQVYAERQRVCGIGGLSELYLTPDGTIGYRCPAEPIAVYVKKGGNEAETHGRVCLCEGLLATAGRPQRRGDTVEPPIITLGDDISTIVHMFNTIGMCYGAETVIDYVLGV